MNSYCLLYTASVFVFYGLCLVTKNDNRAKPDIVSVTQRSRIRITDILFFLNSYVLQRILFWCTKTKNMFDMIGVFYFFQIRTYFNILF